MFIVFPFLSILSIIFFQIFKKLFLKIFVYDELWYGDTYLSQETGINHKKPYADLLLPQLV